MKSVFDGEKYVQCNDIIKTDESNKQETVEFFEKAGATMGWNVHIQIIDENNAPGVVTLTWLTAN